MRLTRQPAIRKLQAVIDNIHIHPKYCWYGAQTQICCNTVLAHTTQRHNVSTLNSNKLAPQNERNQKHCTARAFEYTRIASRHPSTVLKTDSSTHETMLRKDSTKMHELITAATSDLEAAEDPCTGHSPLASRSHSCCPAA
jgi:hypothetical protein